MTRRLKYPEYWASGGTATDPDLDTTAPSYIADRYEKIGWESEKPPEQWQNFLTQITDEKVIGKMIDGITAYDASVNYQEGAIYRKADKFYRIQNGIEQELLSVEKAVYESLIAAANKLLSDHLAADNPHNDTVNTLVGGGYIKPDVDEMFGDPTDPRTIVFHKLQTGAVVHGETAASTGALPAATGGNFTGDVIFLNEAIIQVTPSKYLHYNKATAIFEIVNGTYALGVDGAGNGYISGTGGYSLVLSERNLDTITIKYNNSFALPVPYISMNIETDICDANSVGAWTIDTDTDPVHEEGKGYVVQSTNSLDGVAISKDHTVVIRGWDAGTDVVHVYDVTVAAGTYVYIELNDLVNANGVTTTNVKQLIIYPKLTDRQKSTLVNK